MKDFFSNFSFAQTKIRNTVDKYPFKNSLLLCNGKKKKERKIGCIEGTTELVDFFFFFFFSSTLGKLKKIHSLDYKCLFAFLTHMSTM